MQQLRGHQHGRDGACHEDFARAKGGGVDIVGLSGLITPNLEELQVVAAEMQKDGILSGSRNSAAHRGATTAAVHTAVKIA